MVVAVSGLTPPIVSPARPEDALDWNRFVREHPDGTFCHLWQWGDLLTEVFGHRPRHQLVRGDDGNVLGVLPLIEMRAFDGRHLISLPYINYGGPIGSAEARAALTRRALEMAQTGRARSLELRSRSDAATGLAPSRTKVTVVLPLPDTVEALWERTFRSKLRSQVRRAQKEQMQVRFGAGEVGSFYRVFSRNMRDLGTPVLPRSFFTGLTRHFADEVVFGAVYAGDEAVAAGCGFVARGEFEMTWASSLREFNAKSPNMLLYSAFMEEMIQRGVSRFNFGRCTPGGGTHRFKLQWGAADEPLHWTRWPTDEGVDEEPGAAFRWAARTWQRLPLRLAEAVGPHVAARLPQY